jgi:hypothetical protein
MFTMSQYSLLCRARPVTITNEVGANFRVEMASGSGSPAIAPAPSEAATFINHGLITFDCASDSIDLDFKLDVEHRGTLEFLSGRAVFSGKIDIYGDVYAESWANGLWMASTTPGTYATIHSSANFVGEGVWVRGFVRAMNATYLPFLRVQHSAAVFEVPAAAVVRVDLLVLNGAGELAIDGILSLRTNMDWPYGTLTGSGFLEVQAFATLFFINSGTKAIRGGRVVNWGTIEHRSSQHLYVAR